MQMGCLALKGILMAGESRKMCEMSDGRIMISGIPVSPTQTVFPETDMPQYLFDGFFCH